MSVQPPEWTEDTTHYDVLGVDADASTEDVKRAFRALSRKYHPDVVGPEGTQVIARASEAYTVLSSPERREEYDRELAGEFDEPDAYEPPTFEDAWGQEDEWVPEEEEPTTEEWLEEHDVPEDIDQWGEDVVVDEEVLEDPDPTPAPTGEPSPPPSQDPDLEAPLPPKKGTQLPKKAAPPEPPAAPTFKRPAQRALPVLAATLVLCSAAAILAVSGWAQGPDPLMGGARPALTVAVAAILGGVLGVFLRRAEDPSRPTKPGQRPTAKGPMKENLPTAAVLSVAAAGAAFFLIPSAYSLAACAAAALVVAAAGMYLLTYYHLEQTRLDRIIQARTLRDATMFGSLPGGVAADLTDRVLGLVTLDKATRVVRTGAPDKPFTHAIIRGNRVAFVRGVVAESGAYRWSGPSLLRERPGAHPEEITKGPYREALQAISRRLGGQARVRAWVMVHDPALRGTVTYQGSEGMPQVGGPKDVFDQVQAFLGEAPMVVDQQMVVDSVVALNS